MSSGVFPFWRIALDAAVASAVSLGLLLALRRRLSIPSLGEASTLAGVVGLSVLAWRTFANTRTRGIVITSGWRYDLLL